MLLWQIFNLIKLLDFDCHKNFEILPRFKLRITIKLIIFLTKI